MPLLFPQVHPSSLEKSLRDRSLFSFGLTIFVLSLCAMVGLSFYIPRGNEAVSAVRIVVFLVSHLLTGFGMGLICRSRGVTWAWGAFSPVLGFLFVLLCDGRVLDVASTILIVPFHFIPLILTITRFAETRPESLDEQDVRIILVWVFLLTLATVTAPIALAYGIKAIEFYHRRKRESTWPVVLTVAAAFATFLSVSGIRSFSHRQAPPAVQVAQGKLSLVRLPPNWADMSSVNEEPKIDVLVASKSFIGIVQVNPIPKAERASLEEIANAAAADSQIAPGPSYKRLAPTVRTVGDRKRMEFVFVDADKSGVEGVRILTFWETPRYFWMTRALTDHSGYRDHISELRFVADNVHSME